MGQGVSEYSVYCCCCSARFFLLIRRTKKSILVRTGCSAALVALHASMRRHIRGECESAIVGGSNLILAPGMTATLSEQGMLASGRFMQDFLGGCGRLRACGGGLGRLCQAARGTLRPATRSGR